MIPKSELRIERLKRSKGKGGQNVNKVASCVRVTHVPSGLQVEINGRDQSRNLEKALKELEKRVQAAKLAVKADQKKARRDRAIHDTRTVRTYDFKSGMVKDHRTKKMALINAVLVKGNIDLLR
jgi:peptide chain release factor 1